MPIKASELAVWSTFQRETLEILGIDTLTLFAQRRKGAVNREEGTKDITNAKTKTASKTVIETEKKQTAQLHDASQIPNHANKTPSVKSKPEIKDTSSVVEMGQREAWKAAIDRAHGCFIYATTRVTNGRNVLIMTESPNITTASDQTFANDTLATLMTDMLASIELDALKFTRWQNAIEYLPYERRDDAEPDIAGFQRDFTRLIAGTSVTHMLALGQLTAKLVLKSPALIGKLRGQAHDLQVNERNLQVFALYHPTFLLRAPAHKRTQWQDLKRAYRALYQQDD